MYRFSADLTNRQPFFREILAITVVITHPFSMLKPIKHTFGGCGVEAARGCGVEGVGMEVY